MVSHSGQLEIALCLCREYLWGIQVPVTRFLVVLSCRVQLYGHGTPASANFRSKKTKFTLLSSPVCT